MGFQHRKILPQIKIGGDDCEKACKLPCSNKPGEDCRFPPPPPPSTLSNHVVGKSLILSGSLIGGFLLLFVVFLIMKRYFSRRNSSTERNLPILFDIQQDFVDDDHGPVIDHHIWFINTVGLPQSVIDSITACEYRKEEGLIEGTECSVCLSEFEEGESVRLLPKCSHAFHLSCIDTWLRSHKNCPLCRAPIVRDVAAHSTPQASVTEPNSNDFRSLEDTQLENSENHGGQLSHEVDEGGTSEVSVRVDVGEIELEYARNAANRIKGLSNAAVRSCDSRALSDLVDKREVVGKEIEPMRRSVSMDASSAVAIYRAVANVVSDQGSSNSVSDQGSSNSQLAVPMKSSNLAIVSKRVTQNLSLYKFMRSSSIGRSLQKGPTSMKRSYSSSRKSLSSKHGRSHSSILPS